MPVRLATAQDSKAPAYLRGSVVEDALELRLHCQPLHGRAQRPGWKGITDGVAHERPSLAIGLQFVGVVPELVRTGELDVDEAPRRVEVLYSRQPHDRQTTELEPVFDQGAGAHLDRSRTGDAKTQTGRGDLLEILRLREELEDFARRPGKALDAREGVVGGHHLGATGVVAP